MYDYYDEIARRLRLPRNETLETAIEGSCITFEDWKKNPDRCILLIRGALEELEGGY